MLAASNMSPITPSKSSFSFGVSSHLVRGSLSFGTREIHSWVYAEFGFSWAHAVRRYIRAKSLRPVEEIGSASFSEIWKLHPSVFAYSLPRIVLLLKASWGGLLDQGCFSSLYEVIVVTNNGHDETVARKQRFAKALYLFSENSAGAPLLSIALFSS